ncbi:Rho GTPase activation protein [Nemania sp. FL0031]|nr:Rho GTPase activation protein [Nemania sp. FL0031]
MADPLSVTASVLGIISAAAKISTGLAGIIKKAHNAPTECRKLQLEVDDVRTILGQLQEFILGTRRAPRSRTSLILVDQVITTLAACVTTFSELDTFTEALQSESDLHLLDRLRWVSKESELQAILIRIESHKSSLNLMLMILTCQKQEEAEDQVDHLCHLVQKVLDSNATIAQRLVAIEGTSRETSNPTVTTTVTTDAPHPIEDLNYSEPSDSQAQGARARDKRGFAFEEVLMNSRAYRKVSLDNSDAFSIISSAGRTGSWSMLSGLSLSETSHIGILAIPIYETDIANKEAYDFSPPEVEPSSPFPETEPGGILNRSHKTSRRQWLIGLFRGDRSQQQMAQMESEAEKPSPIFGVPLQQSITYANHPVLLIGESGKNNVFGYLPVLVAKVGSFLKDEGIYVEDVFALNGNPARIMQLQIMFEKPPKYGAGLAWDGYTIHDAASLLQRYLKMLPEPIIPYAMYDDFVNVPEAAPGATDEDLIEPTRPLIMALPPLNRQLLLYILDILAVFADNFDINKMTVERLAATFQPAILSARPAKINTEAHSNSTRMVIFLVEYGHHFLAESMQPEYTGRPNIE